MDQPAPAIVLHKTEHPGEAIVEVRRPLKRSYAMLGNDPMHAVSVLLTFF
jgi:hypothetical protein